MRILWVLGLFSLVSCGCMRTAVVQFWAPPILDVGHVNRIVIADFSGAQGTAVTNALKSELRQNEFYTVIDSREISAEIQLASHVAVDDPGRQLQEVLATARARDIEGLLTGAVVEYRCEDRKVRKAAFSNTASTDDESRPSSRRIGSGPAREWRETEVRDAVVSIEFQLIDVETGEFRACKTITHTYTSECDGVDGKLPDPAETLEELTKRCLNDIVELLAPHETTAEIQLASCDVWTRGRREVYEGNRLAAAGKWELAEEQWKEAVRISPKNHAALFNLAIAADHRQQYAEAEELAMQALRLQHKTCYTMGLNKIREHKASALKLEEQRDARVATVLESRW